MAGFIAGTAMDLAETAAYVTFRQPEYRSKDWIALIFTGKRPVTPSQSIMAETGHIFFTTLLGGAFATLQPKSEKHPVLCGFLWSMGAFTVTQVLTKVLKIPILSRLGWRNRIQHLCLALIYGSVLGTSLHLMKQHKS